MVKAGPSKNIALNDNNEPTQALEGFLRSNNSTIENVFWQDSGKGEVACIRQIQQGLETEKLLPEWIESVIKSIPFPKKMLWGKGGLSFARPIRWLVCLWETDILPLNFGGLEAGRISYGNRFSGLEHSVQISSPKSYFKQLKSIQVIAEREERVSIIKNQLESMFPGKEYSVVMDKGLLNTVADLVEYPTAVVAEFEEKFLVLPEKIIISTISTNQKYFAVNDKTGKLSNKFVFISNGNPNSNELIRKGNEKVVKPRLEDAMWYYQEDTKQPLDSFVPQLNNVVFQAKLGTLANKVKRITELSSELSKKLNLSETEYLNVTRTAQLSKADLVTRMLGEKEFTKLQGYIGMHYALASGENQEVAKGIYEHYMPRGQADELPQTLCGAIVAVSDKLDTVCGIIGIGMLPTGSADPFALRRAANGIVQIIAERKWDINLQQLISYSLQRFDMMEVNAVHNFDIISKYFHQRINWYLQQQQIDYDVIDSVMHIDFGSILHLIQRADALQKFKTHEDFIKLVIGFKRVSNIIKEEKQILKVDDSNLKEPAEINLFNALKVLESDIEKELIILHYEKVLTLLVGIRVFIDKFFDDVLVNTDEIILKQNRYALLQEIRNQFLKVADLSILAVEGKSEQ